MSSVTRGVTGAKRRIDPRLNLSYGLLLLPVLGLAAFFWFVTHHVTKPEITIFEAAESGNFRAVRDHLATGTPIDSLSGAGHTALFLAIQGKHHKIVDFLLDNGAPVNAENRSVTTPLYVAAGKGNDELVKRLIELGADVNARSKNGLTPLNAATDSGNPKVVKHLLKSGADPNGGGNKSVRPPLCGAAERGDLDSVQMLVKHGADINARGFLGRKPLHLATARGHFDVVRFLIQSGADPDHPDQQGTIPLASALVHSQDPRTFWLLYRHTTNFEASDFQQGNLLHYAVSSRARTELLKALLAKGLDVNRVDYQGQTPLSLALAANNVEAARVLEAEGARVPLRTLIRAALAPAKQPRRAGFMDTE